MTAYTPLEARELADTPLHKSIEPLRNAARSLANQVEALTAEHEAIKQQAQIWKMEADTQKATVHEIYQLCTGATGEPGDWHGAAPVRELLSDRDALRHKLDTACVVICDLGGELREPELFEVAALKATTLKFKWMLEALTEPPECKKELLLFAALDKMKFQGLTPIELVACLDVAISDAMKHTK